MSNNTLEKIIDNRIKEVEYKKRGVPIEQLEDDDKVGNFESKINMEKAERFDRFMESATKL